MRPASPLLPHHSLRAECNPFRTVSTSSLFSLLSSPLLSLLSTTLNDNRISQELGNH